jgi:ribosome-binding factor A
MERRFSFKRSDKIAERIRQELAELFLREVEDPRLRAITITGVDIEDDLSEGEVRICKSMLGEFAEPTAEEKKKTEKALKAAAPFIFERLKKRLAIRHTPWLRYRYDDSLAKSAKVWALLNKERGLQSEVTEGATDESAHSETTQ